MGTEASKPAPSLRLQVIGAGLPRTGTASLSEALRILLHGPVYHGGTQVTLGPKNNVLGWIDIMYKNPPSAQINKGPVKRILGQLLDGYVAVTDAPAHMYVAELLELYPEAKVADPISSLNAAPDFVEQVICTTRDPERWAESLDKIAATSTQGFLRFALFLLPSLRHFPNYCDALAEGRWNDLYGPHEGNPYVPHRQVYERHMDYLERSVPKEKLVFFDVREGWGPLCRVLNLPVPQVEFPNVNDATATDRFAKKQVQIGLLRWLSLFGAVVALVLGALCSLGQV